MCRVLLIALALSSARLLAQIAVSGRVIDETGSGVEGFRVEARPGGGTPVSASSDRAGNFSLNLPEPGTYSVRAERLGFYLYQSEAQRFSTGYTELTIVLNHLQEFSDR